MITNHPLKPEYRQAVMKVLSYINQNLAGDVSLETMASIANYSPFHFQRIFSEAVSESPKQYVIRLRLERAAHFIKLFPALSISEIALGSGFSSDSIFSRAFKNYYGITAEMYRNLPSDQMNEINKKRNSQYPFDDATWITPITNIDENIEKVRIEQTPILSTIFPFTIACVQTTLSHKENIAFAFKTLFKWANPRGLVTTNTKYFGIWLDFPFITPYAKCRFLCGMGVSPEIKLSQGISSINFNKGLYLNYSLTGNIDITLNSLIALNHNYIDSIGYTISEMICYEQFEENPVEIPYEKTNRQLLIPVKIK